MNNLGFKSLSRVSAALWVLLLSVSFSAGGRCQTATQSSAAEAGGAFPIAAWSAAVDTISRETGRRVLISFPRKQAASISPRQSSSEIMRSMARQLNGQWFEWHKILLLVPRVVPAYISTTDTSQLANVEFHQPWLRFFSALTEGQMSTLTKGGALELASLSAEQKTFLTDVGKRGNPFLLEQLKLFDTGKLAVSVSGDYAYDYFGAVSLDVQRKASPEAAPSPTKLPTTEREFIPPIQSLFEQNARLFGDNRVDVKDAREVPIGEIPAIAETVDHKTVVISEVLRDRELVASSGRWLPSELATSLNMVTRSEMRIVGGGVFLAPNSEERKIAISVNLTDVGKFDSQTTRQLEGTWRFLRSLMLNLKDNPDSKIGPVPWDVGSNPHLSWFSELSPELKKFVASEGYPDPPSEDQQKSGDTLLQIFLGYNVQVKFFDDKKSWRTGFSAPYTYTWLLARTIASNSAKDPLIIKLDVNLPAS